MPISIVLKFKTDWMIETQIIDQTKPYDALLVQGHYGRLNDASCQTESLYIDDNKCTKV